MTSLLIGSQQRDVLLAIYTLGAKPGIPFATSAIEINSALGVELPVDALGALLRGLVRGTVSVKTNNIQYSGSFLSSCEISDSGSIIVTVGATPEMVRKHALGS